MAGECPFCHKLQHLQELPDDELVWQFPHSVVLLGSWQFYRGYCIVVNRRHVSELSELPPAQRHGFFDEMCLTAQAIEVCFRPRKLNYELLGNQVPHLHWHLFPRQADDPEVLRPVWFALDRAESSEQSKLALSTGPLPRAEIRARLRVELERFTSSK
jgi:diadenosine tetraphosphate (Ap4A) HIT family hydrolase